MFQDKPLSLHSYTYDRYHVFLTFNYYEFVLLTQRLTSDFFFCSLNSDVASGKEMSDGYESLPGGGKGDGKPRKHHRKSARTRSRQEKASKPKLSMLNVSCDETKQTKKTSSVFVTVKHHTVPAGLQHW